MCRVPAQRQRCAKTLVNTNPCAKTLEVKGKEGPYQDRPPLCPFRLLPLLIYSGSAIAFFKFQSPKSKNIENVILLQP